MTRPTISLQAAIGPGDAQSNVFIIGSSLLGGTDVLAGGIIAGQGTWEELADRAEMISIRRGRQRLLEQYRAGTLATLLDNTDRALDPTWTDGPYVTASGALTTEYGELLTTEDGEVLTTEDSVGASNIEPDRAVRVQVTWLGVTYDRFYGFADDWPPVYSYPEGGWSQLSATDAFKVLTNTELATDVSQGSGDSTGERLGRLLDAVNWDSEWRDLDDGAATHQATTLDGNAASQMRTVADSERGHLFIDGDGTPTHRGRYHRLTSTRSRQVQWVFGDGDGEINVSAFGPANDEALKRNDVNVSRVGGSTITRQTAEAIAYPHKRKSYNRSDLTLEDDAQVVEYADWVVRLFGEVSPRIDWIEVEPDGYETAFEPVLAARWGDRVSVNVTHPYDGSRWSGQYFIEGFDEDIPVVESGGIWRTRFYLADASKFSTSVFIIGTSLLGGVDTLL